MDRAIDIKRRAQRCIQSGDLQGALAEYEKLVAADASDPYSYVLIADLLYKMGEHARAGERYLTAAACYEKAGLYKNAIAVAKKMMRLALLPAAVLERLAALHALDGLPAESSLYSTQFAEHLVRESRLNEAAEALRRAFDTCPENVKALERMAEVQGLADDEAAAARSLAEAAFYYARTGQDADAARCRTQAEKLRPGAVAEFEAQAPPPPAPRAGAAAPTAAPEPGVRLAAPEAEASATEAATETAVEAPDDEPLDTDRPPRFVPPAERVPGLELDRPVREEPSRRGPAPLPTPAPAPPEAAEPEPEPEPEPSDLAAVERLLGLAQTEFRAGRRESAAAILARAAGAYDELGRFDEAGAIYRSLAKGAAMSVDVMERWLANCDRRDDRAEAASVACELGDRAIQENELDRARGWFERATAYDPAHAVARRRLERLDPQGAGTTAPESTDGRVEVAVDRGQAVTFDFASMLAEFQRGVETQIAADSQAHYDLAMAYREMGLIEQAIESFRLAAQDVRFRQRGAEMVGRCLLEDGRFEEAVHELSEALGLGGLDADTTVGLRFQLGLALEAAGRAHEALGEFERVAEVQPGDPEVDGRIRELRKHLEAA